MRITAEAKAHGRQFCSSEVRVELLGVVVKNAVINSTRPIEHRGTGDEAIRPHSDTARFDEAMTRQIPDIVILP